MNKKLARIVSCIAALSTVAAFTVGCTAESNHQTPNKDGASISASGTDTKEMIGNMYTKGYPIVKEKETYKMVSSFDTRQRKFDDMEFFKKLEDQSNIHIEWDLIESQDFNQKKNLILASGDYPDAFFMTVTNTDLNMYAPQGVFIPMDEHLKYAPNINKSFEEHPDFKNLCTYFDGKIYSVGSANENPCEYNPDNLFIYKPWLDKLGLSVPKTIDEFYNVLKAFKDKDPNGNGIPDEIPYSAQATNGIRGFQSLSGAFGPVVYGTASPGAANFVYEENDVIKFSANTQNYKNFVKFCQKMFSEGLFDQEIFTQDSKQYFAKGKTETVTLGSFTLWNAENMAGAQRAAEYVPVPTMKGPNGDQNWTNNKLSNGAINGTCFAITNKCKTPEVLVRWVDQFYDKKTSVEAVWGPIEKGTDGMYKFVPFPQGSTFDKFRYENCPTFAPACVYATDYNTFVEMPPMNVSKMKIKEECYDPYPKTNTIPLMQLTDEETNWITTTGGDISTFVYDNMAKWMLKGGIDAEWDAYVKKLDGLNVKKHLEVLQGAYNRTVGKK